MSADLGHQTSPGDGGDGGAEESYRTGTVALVGRPNAGKSTLMNHWLAEKVAIVSAKPQTTRQRIVGILSDERGQIVFYDTPGVHRPQHGMNRRMLKMAREALNDADLVCLLVDVSQPPGSGDRYLRQWVDQVEAPKVVLLNKIDLVKKPRLLPLIAGYAGAGFEEIIPVSALKGDGTDGALEAVRRLLPEGPPIYDTELVSIHPERFLVAERIREKVLEQTRDELPFSVAVVIDAWEDVPETGLTKIYASILAERSGQKKILVGAHGSRVKSIGTAARKDIEAYLDRRVYLDLKVRVESDWRENERILSQLDRAPYASSWG
ncbi:MAG: GTPase Era [Thermoanaerobaculia bacterium]